MKHEFTNDGEFRIWALLSNQGTAMYETVLLDCEVECPGLVQAVYDKAARTQDWSGNKRFVDVSGNDALNGHVTYS